MKRNLFLVLPLLVLIVLGEACSPKNDNIPLAPPPLGTFGGRFKLLVKKTTGSGYDTVKKDTLFSVKLSQPNNYVVTTKSTSNVHALSRGNFQYDPNLQLIAFYDSTYVAGPQTAIRLIGTYQYAYDGTTNLIMQRANSVQDSVLRYELKKTSN